MIITHHNVEVKRCLAPFDTIAIVENNMHKEKEKREKHESGRTKKKTDGAFVNPPFYCDYGKNIEVGKNFFANYNVWLGGNTVVCPGVHIGSNVVIGAGSVVTKDIPDWSIAAGNPCKVIRSITEDDKRLLFHNEEIDDEAWADIASRMSF